ncbi:hypothetical protein VUR80DRAFT_8678 [Thermomyces stellatus]
MYLRSAHVEEDLGVLHQLIRENPLGLLTTAIKTESHPFLQASHIPMVLDAPSATEPGILRCHIARQNPQGKAMIEELTSGAEPRGNGGVLEQEVLVMFTAEHHHYVTPKFYVETKPDTGKVVPTWNYAAAQAYGRARVFFDSKAEETSAFLDRQIADLTRNCEGDIMGYTGKEGQAKAWEVTDAPTSYIEILKKNIIGIEIKIDRLEGKFKMSQEMRKGDREGVADGFLRMESDAAQGVGMMVKERAALKDAATRTLT